jgi:asparagine synthase (glutamine-hydrolysing)
MIRGRYLAVIAADEQFDAFCTPRFWDRLRGYGLEVVQSGPTYSLAVDRHLPFSALRDERGALMGQVHGPDRIAGSGGAPLHRPLLPWGHWHIIMRDNWGDFVVLNHDGKSAVVDVARSPQGQLPCYYVEMDGVTIIASDVRLLVAAGYRPSINALSVYRHLHNLNLRPALTCLRDVMELQGGHVLTVSTEAAIVTEFWNPWRFASREAQIADLPEAPSMLRKIVVDSVRKTSSDSRHVLLGLSGGLDSSIVAASLAQAGIPFSCFNLVTRDASGDERGYAREVAAHLGVPLHEVPESIDKIDLLRCDGSHLPRPLARAFAQSGNAAHLSLGAQLGADAFASGGGGDNVFCFLQSARALADSLRMNGPGRTSWKAARDLALLTDSSLWSAWVKGIQRAWFRPHDYLWTQDRSFLNPDFQEVEDIWSTHPWTSTPKGELPGKAQHIAWILGVRNHIEGYGREQGHATLWPLLSQPVVEYCLRLPTWTWIDGGRDRVIAREAFVPLLPERVLRRRTKGTPDSFVVEIFERNRKIIQEMLCDGWLASQGLIDREAVAARCHPSVPTRGHSYWQVMRLVDVEAWAQSWTDAG